MSAASALESGFAWLVLALLGVAVLAVAVAVLLVLLRRTRAALREHQVETDRLRLEIDELEERYFRARKMEAVGNLAGSVIHRFNNLLAVILGHTRLVQADLEDDAPARKELDHVVKAGRLASNLVSELSAFYRQADTRRKPVHLQQPIREVVALLRDLVPPTITVEDRIEADCGPVLASAVQVQQVVMNLASNAIRAMYRRRGRIFIELEETDIAATLAAHPQELPAGDYARLTVRDTGRGMDAETLARIVEPYFTDRRSGKGLGLGLTTVYQIVASHGGSTVAHSRPGQGTRIEVYFPVIARSVPMFEVVPAPGAAEEPAPTAVRVLLVDDEEMVLRVTKAHLERRGHQVTGHGDPQAALDELRARPFDFDILITDQIMGPMTGVRLAREALAIRSDLPVVLATGFRGSFSEEKARQIGIRATVTKPFSHAELERVVARFGSGISARRA